MFSALRATGKYDANYYSSMQIGNSSETARCASDENERKQPYRMFQTALRQQAQMQTSITKFDFSENLIL